MAPHQEQKQDKTSPDLYVDRERHDVLTRVKKVASKDPLSIQLLKLGWTAGPVTFIGLQTGYYMGYGRFASMEIFVYFAVFTIVAGLAAVLSSLTYKSMKVTEEQQVEEDFRILHDLLPNLIIESQNLHLELLPPEDRTLEAAGPLLKNSHASASAIEQATLDLTGNEKLARAAREIEIFRQAGLFTHIRDIRDTIQPDIDAAIAKLREKRPDLAGYLSERLNGNAPTLKQGLPRSVGFIERLLAMIDTDDESLIRPRDVEELFTLAFELLCGREIPLLSIRYYGRRKIASAASRLEQARDSFRIAQAARFSRLKALSRLLKNCPYIESTQAQTQASAALVLKDINTDMHMLCDTINRLMRDNAIGDRTVKRHNDRNLRNMVHILGDALVLYKRLLDAHRRVQLRRDDLKQALSHWEQLGKTANTAFNDRNHGRGIRIAQRMIRLNDAEKITFVQQLAPILRDYKNHKLSSGMVFRADNLQPGPSNGLTMDTAKELAIAIIAVLDPMIHLSRADTQRAIEYSNAPNFGSIEWSFSANGKARWGTAVTAEVENNLDRLSERLARALIQQYNVELDDSTVDFFVENYQARREILNHYVMTLKPGTSFPALSSLEKLPETPVLHRSWQQIFERGNSFIKQAKSST